ncbi:MAG: VOC family protein [Pseudomonadales bacterium]|nr:VOC family protein [Pseudomonadales bacterium]
MEIIGATDSPVAKQLGYRQETTCAINVSDFARAAKWYEEVLGFQKLYDVPEMGWGEWKTNVPGMTVGLSQVEMTTTPAGGGATLTFGVIDIASSRRLLESKGVRFDGETQEIPGLVRLATFFDPDGNAFMLAEGLSS